PRAGRGGPGDVRHHAVVAVPAAAGAVPVPACGDCHPSPTIQTCGTLTQMRGILGALRGYRLPAHVDLSHRTDHLTAGLAPSCHERHAAGPGDGWGPRRKFGRPVRVI